MNHRRRPHKSAESKKISKLVHEGVPQEQSVAETMSMKRAGRLTKSGGYIRAGRRRRGRGSKRS